MPPSGHQTEAIDLNEGKTPAQMFASDCAVCHQRPNGLAKGRSAGQLSSFLRQHYTTGTQQAGLLAAYLTSSGMDRGAPARATGRDAPERPAARERTPATRPPAAIGTRRSPESDEAAEAARGEGRSKPAATEASKPAERDAPPPRRPVREDTRKPPAERQPAPTASKPAAPEAKDSEAPAASAPAAETPAAASAPAAPPAEEKPAAPPPPPVPEIRI